MIISLGPRYLLSDRSPVGEPGRAWNQSGWGIPRWGAQRIAAGMMGPMKPMPIGARYFCGDCESVKENKPVAFGHKFGATKAAYQEEITAHMTENHKDLHYPIPQDLLDAHEAAKSKAHAKLILLKNLQDVGVQLTKAEKKLIEPDFGSNGNGIGGGQDYSSSYQAVSRPRELPDFTEFDFPDANVADDGVEEIEFDQLISIQARMGRRFLGVELQNLDVEAETEFTTAPDNADLVIDALLEFNTRTGGFNLDDPENLWRFRRGQAVANVEATAGTGAAISADYLGINNVPPGGRVYVSPRGFWRFTNQMDRQVDTGDLFALLATIDQRLGTFLLFELLEQYSGLFGLT